MPKRSRFKQQFTRKENLSPVGAALVEIPRTLAGDAAFVERIEVMISLTAEVRKIVEWRALNRPEIYDSLAQLLRRFDR